MNSNEMNDEDQSLAINKKNFSNEEAKKFIEEAQTDEKKKIGLTKKQCIKNLVVLSISMFFLACGHSSIANLQSSLNTEASLGTVSLFVVFSSFFLSCLFMPSLLMSKFGYKWSIIICEIGHVVYIAANLYVKWWTLIPGF